MSLLQKYDSPSQGHKIQWYNDIRYKLNLDITFLNSVYKPAWTICSTARPDITKTKNIQDATKPCFLM